MQTEFELKRASVHPVADRCRIERHRAVVRLERFVAGAQFHQSARAIAVRFGEIRAARDRAIEARQRILWASGARQRHA